MILALFAAVLICAQTGKKPDSKNDKLKPVNIGSNRELFADKYLIGEMKNVRFDLKKPESRGKAIIFDKPWEGPVTGYYTDMVKDGKTGHYKCYYRGNLGEYYRAAEKKKKERKKGIKKGEKLDALDYVVFCVAESKDGIHWTKPELNLFDYHGSKKNNIVVPQSADGVHNLTPFYDENPACKPEERYKALAAPTKDFNRITKVPGRPDSKKQRRRVLYAFSSPDGIHWKKMLDKPVIAIDDTHKLTCKGFDSQNVVFWSKAENCYVCFFRVWESGPNPDPRTRAKRPRVKFRRISKATSKDFIHWNPSIKLKMVTADGAPGPEEHFYVNQTQPYLRAPHIYISTPVRFNPYRGDLTDIVFMAIRPDSDTFTRLFLESMIRPGLPRENWCNRGNYPSVNLVRTGPDEMSIYVSRATRKKAPYLERLVFRLDGIVSVKAPFSGGELITKPLIFAGKTLSLNLSTSIAGSVKVEIQDENGKPVPGFTIDDCKEIYGDFIDRAVIWKHGKIKTGDVSSLAGKPVKLRFVMKDADLYSFKFEPAKK